MYQNSLVVDEVFDCDVVCHVFVDTQALENLIVVAVLAAVAAAVDVVIDDYYG